MFRLILFLVVVTALAIGAGWLADRPGTVVMQWQGYHIEMALTVLVAAVALLALALAVLLAIVRWILRLPRRFRERRVHHREVQGHHAVVQGLLAAAAGDTAGARRHARSAERMLADKSAGMLMLTAQTAQLESRDEVAQLKFRQMLKSPESELLGLRGLMAQAMKDGDDAAALKLARRAHASRPDAVWVLTTLFDLLIRTHNWRDALGLITELARNKVIDRHTATRRKAVIGHMLAGQLDAEEKHVEALRVARMAHQNAPEFAPAALQAARMAGALGKTRQARRAIEDTWSLAPHPALARAYAELVPNEGADARLRRFERLYNRHPNNSVTLVALAELAMAAREWDVARGHLERAMKYDPSMRVYRLFAELERSIGTSAEAERWVKKAMEARPDDCWVCDDTGTILPDWAPFGPSGRFDCVEWTSPPRIATLIGDNSENFILTHSEARDDGDTAADPVVTSAPPPPMDPVDASRAHG